MGLTLSGHSLLRAVKGKMVRGNAPVIILLPERIKEFFKQPTAVVVQKNELSHLLLGQE